MANQDAAFGLRPLKMIGGQYILKTLNYFQFSFDI